MTARRVVVVGGGFAGLAAAVRLGRGGAQVTLLERRPFLGGRAYSFADPATGEVVDNGPHALMGAYTEALDFLREIGASAKLRVQPRLRVALAHPELGVGEVAGDRVRLLAGALRLAARDRALAGRTVAQALADVGQSRAACERFWHPLAIATLNEAPEMAAAAPFAAVLRRAFFAGARAARFALAAVPLSELYTADARHAIEAAGGSVVTGAAVASLALEAEHARAVLLRDGRRVDADAVILAVPCAALLRLLPPALRAAPPFRALAAVGTSPIVSVHLWLDRPVGWGSSFLGLLGGRAQWLFDCGPARDGGRRVASVTSGARFWNDASDEAIAAEVLADAGAVLPALRAARCTRALVVRERHATISLTPAADAVRPRVTTPLANLFLAGDWVQTGLPATIEGAVQAGREAAARALGAPLVRARAEAARRAGVG